MAKNIALTTIGVKVSYCDETTAGSRPTTNYQVINGIYSTPDFNIAPSTTDTTDFSNKEYTSKTALLKEIPDSVEFGVRFGQVFADTWEALCAAYATGIKDSKETWFCIDIPGYDKSMFFTGKPLSLGIPAMEANSSIDMSVYIAPTGEPIVADDPEYKAEA